MLPLIESMDKATEAGECRWRVVPAQRTNYTIWLLPGG
jgi:hypothetical protein